jgi:hypothetical protein
MIPVLGATILLSLVIIRIGAVALEITGLDAAMAHFQALSAFTGTGFTTREAELVVRHAQRRKILQMLMVAGNIGIVTVMAGMVRTFQMDISVTVVLLKLVAIALSFYILYRVVLLPRINQWVERQISARLRRYVHIEPVHFEEILEQEHGWGIFKFMVSETMPCAGETLARSKLRQQGVTVIAIDRQGQLIPAPGGSDLLMAGDGLIVYTQLEQLEKLMGRSVLPSEDQPQG